MFREAATASEASTEMEKFHHFTAALYFGISALEAFLNAKMRAYMTPAAPEQDIYNMLRRGKIVDKLKEWPKQLVGQPLSLNSGTMNLLADINDVRGNLTHPKTSGHDVYVQLSGVEPATVVNAVAEYIVRFHEAERTKYPYWIFGWNYLNPSRDKYEIMLIHDQQFSFSLQCLGFNVPAADALVAEKWRGTHLGTYAGYCAIRDALSRVEHCEPKQALFVYRPTLCRRWWTSEHQGTCGHVSDAAIRAAMEADKARGQKR